jgi:MSHA pilin protein MshD
MSRFTAVRGFTLVELVVAITIVGVVSSTILGLMAVISERSAAVLMKQQAAAIANSYIQEALSKPFAAGPGPRDDVADYNFNHIGAYDQMGNAIVGLSGYRVLIFTQPALLAGVPAAQSYLVTVTVTDPAGGSTSVSGYKMSP